MRDTLVKPHRIAAKHGLFIGLSKVISTDQLVDLAPAFGGVENLVRKVATEQE